MCPQTMANVYAMHMLPVAVAVHVLILVLSMAIHMLQGSLTHARSQTQTCHLNRTRWLGDWRRGHIGT